MANTNKKHIVDSCETIMARIPLITETVGEALLAARHHTCFFTGHRDMPAHHQLRLQELLISEVESLVYQGFSVFTCGGARGFDLMAAAAVLQLQAVHTDLRLVLILPCRYQTRGWNTRDLALYRAVLERGEPYLLQESYDAQCMHRRNRFLVDHAAMGLSYYNLQKPASGTGMTVRYASSQNIPIIDLLSLLGDGEEGISVCGSRTE